MKLDWLDKAVWICPYPGYNTTVVIGLFEAVPRTLSLILHPRLEHAELIKHHYRGNLGPWRPLLTRPDRISLGRARWSQDVGVLAMIPVGSYPVFYLGHVLICLCLHVSMGLGLQSGICGTRWSLAQHVPLTKPCLADDVTCD